MMEGGGDGRGDGADGGEEGGRGDGDGGGDGRGDRHGTVDDGESRHAVEVWAVVFGMSDGIEDGAVIV